MSDIKGVKTTFADHCPVPSTSPSGSVETGSEKGLPGQTHSPNAPTQVIRVNIKK